MASTLQVRIDSNLREAADVVFADIGMDVNSAIRLFLRQVVIRRTFPFEIVGSDPFYQPANQAFLARAVKDYDEGAKHYRKHDLIEVEEARAAKRNPVRRRRSA